MTTAVLVSSRFRDENAKLEHELPLGAVVEVNFDDSAPEKVYRRKDGDVIATVPGTASEPYEEIVIGFRGVQYLVVVGHNRDCDGTPLYILGVGRTEYPPVDTDLPTKIKYEFFGGKTFGCWSGTSLKDTGGRVRIRPWSEVVQHGWFGELR